MSIFAKDKHQYQSSTLLLTTTQKQLNDMKNVEYDEKTVSMEMPETANLTVGQEIPQGYITLEKFGEIFHQKLDSAYAKIQRNSKF